MTLRLLAPSASGLRINLSASTKAADAVEMPRICAATHKICAKDCQSPGPCKDWKLPNG